MNENRYSRQQMLSQIGEEGQRRLLASRVAVIGVGGLGSAVAAYLAGAGVGTLLLADPDTVSLSNLQRQILYSECETGMPKVYCAARRLRELNSDTEIICCPDGLIPENGKRLLAACDLVIDCTDNYPTRYLIDDICAELSIPWLYGSIGEFHGQLTLFGGTACKRYTDLYPDREALCALPRTTLGVLGAVPGVIGSMQACEAVKYLATGHATLDGRLCTVDLLTFDTSIIDF